MEFVPKDRGVVTREASTANLLIDSIDRTFNTNAPTSSSANFNITKNQNILNGFFTRLAVVEVVLDWCVPNVSPVFTNDTLTYNFGGNDYTVTLDQGKYVISTALNTLVTLLNAQSAASGLGLTWSVAGTVLTTGFASLVVVGGPVDLLETNLQTQLNLPIGSANEFPAECPLLLPITYLDFVCDQLTYNQELKDETTNFVGRNTLYRWVLAWEGPSPEDPLGYPIYQGYQSFRARRYLTFPKQIRWEPNQPIGQLTFQVIASTGELVPVPVVGEMEWNMCLQVSEV
jgi:hypothetical protein